MSTTQPIRSKEALDKLKHYYDVQKPNLRNSALIILGLNTALRISDILRLTWSDICDDNGEIREHLEVQEKKTGKRNLIALNRACCTILRNYQNYVFKKRKQEPAQFLFLSQKGKNTPISRSQAYRIIKTAANDCGLYEHVSCHSLRKTFGYHAWQQGCPPALLMSIYNHSSYQITKRYLCIEQDEKDEIYKTISL